MMLSVTTLRNRQLRSLLGQEFWGINVVPIQQQLKGSDCGVFAIAFATSLVFMQDPLSIQFGIPTMRPHLSRCLRSIRMEPFPTVDV